MYTFRYIWPVYIHIPTFMSVYILFADMYRLVYIYMACTMALIGRQGYIETIHTGHARCRTPNPIAIPIPPSLPPCRRAPRLTVLRGKQALCSPLPWGHIHPPHSTHKIAHVRIFLWMYKLHISACESTCCLVIRYGHYSRINGAKCRIFVPKWMDREKRINFQKCEEPRQSVNKAFHAYISAWFNHRMEDKF